MGPHGRGLVTRPFGDGVSNVPSQRAEECVRWEDPHGKRSAPCPTHLTTQYRAVSRAQGAAGNHSTALARHACQYYRRCDRHKSRYPIFKIEFLVSYCTELHPTLYGIRLRYPLSPHTYMHIPHRQRVVPAYTILLTGTWCTVIERDSLTRTWPHRHSARTARVDTTRLATADTPAQDSATCEVRLGTVQYAHCTSRN